MGEVTVKEQVVEVRDVSDLIVTDIEQEDGGDYVREIRVMTKAEGEETQTRSFVLRLASDLAEKLRVLAPSSEF
jgi:hypothetical protein